MIKTPLVRLTIEDGPGENDMVVYDSGKHTTLKILYQYVYDKFCKLRIDNDPAETRQIITLRKRHSVGQWAKSIYKRDRHSMVRLLKGTLPQFFFLQFLRFNKFVAQVESSNTQSYL